MRFSYHEDDLTIVQWDTAFVYDRTESARAIEDILEFANSQLLELRTYDALLDTSSTESTRCSLGARRDRCAGTARPSKPRRCAI